MHLPTLVRQTALAATLAVAALPAATRAATVLYDPAPGTLPAAQGWLPLAIGGAATQAVSGGTYNLDTTGATVVYWGNSRLSPIVLDTLAGFDLSFALQIQSEIHTSANRSGYSVVVVGHEPSQSVELAFWADQVWAQDYDAAQADRFVHGNSAAIDTTAALRQYTLSVRQQQYTLWADGNALLAGSLHDYTSGGPPYTTPDFLFFGDDSSRGSASSRLGMVSIAAAAVPEPASALLALVGLGGMAAMRRQTNK